MLKFIREHLVPSFFWQQAIKCYFRLANFHVKFIDQIKFTGLTVGNFVIGHFHYEWKQIPEKSSENFRISHPDESTCRNISIEYVDKLSGGVDYNISVDGQAIAKGHAFSRDEAQHVVNFMLAGHKSYKLSETEYRETSYRTVTGHRNMNVRIDEHQGP